MTIIDRSANKCHASVPHPLLPKKAKPAFLSSSILTILRGGGGGSSSHHHDESKEEDETKVQSSFGRFLSLDTRSNQSKRFLTKGV
jgi:hypothetical protein